MAKQTHYFRLFQLLRGAPNGLSKEVLAEKMSIAPVSVPVYIFELKKQFKVEIESVRKGKAVIAYKLLNADKAKVPEFRRGAAQRTAKKAVKPATSETTLATKTDTSDEASITVVGEREMSDVAASLGITGIGGGGRYSE